MDNLKFLVIAELIIILFITCIYLLYKHFEKKNIDKVMSFLDKNKNDEASTKIKEFIDIKKGSDK